MVKDFSESFERKRKTGWTGSMSRLVRLHLVIKHGSMWLPRAFKLQASRQKGRSKELNQVY